LIRTINALLHAVGLDASSIGLLLLSLSTIAGAKISNPSWVNFQSAGWVSFQSAPTLTEDAGIIEPCRLHVLSLVEQLRTVLTVIDRFDKKSSGSLLHYRTAHCFGTYQAQVSIWRHACSLPSGSIVSASMARTGCKSTPALPR
jgi:hypothetical protein